MDVSDYLKRRIKETYGSVNNFSKEIGIPQSTLSTALNKKDGFRNMAVGTALKICSKLGIDIDSLEEEYFNEESLEEDRLITIYREVSKPAKGLIMSHAESVKKYDTEILEAEKEQEEVTDIEEKPEGYYDDFPLLAAHGTEGMTKEELDGVMDMARDARVLLRKKKAEMEND